MVVTSLSNIAAELEASAHMLSLADAAVGLKLCDKIATLLRPFATPSPDQSQQKHDTAAAAAAAAATEWLSLCSLPSELLARIISLLPSTEDIGRLDCVSREFRPKPPCSVVEEGLRLRVAQGGYTVAKALPAGQWTWVQALCWDERRRRCGGRAVMAAGDTHSVFVDVSGRLVICGTDDDGYGFLGQGVAMKTMLTPTAIDLEPSVKVISVAAAMTHTLALSEAGTVYSFGRGECGKLGHGDENDQPTPKLIEALQGVRITAIVAGNFHNLVLTEAGAVYRFGGGASGGRPSDEDENHLTPTLIETLRGVRITAIAMGSFHSLVLSEAGTVYSFGRGKCGKLGHGDENDQPTPKLIEALRGMRICAIAACECYSWALSEAGAVYSFGQGKPGGRLGHPDWGSKLTPMRIEALRGVRITAISAGDYHSMALSEAGEVYSAGMGENGELGHGDEEDRLTPTRIEALRGVRITAIVARCFNSLVLSDSGRVYSFGLGYGGRLGHREGEYKQLTPKLIQGLRCAKL